MCGSRFYPGTAETSYAVNGMGSERMTLKEMRLALGLTQGELAEMFREEGIGKGIDKALISKIEAGTVFPSEAMIEACCNRLFSPADERNNAKGITTQSETKTAQNGDLSLEEEVVLDRLMQTDIDHRLTRSEVSLLIAQTDRQARKLIEGLRAKGYRIGSGLGRKGYWLITGESEYKAFRAEYSARAFAVHKTVRAMDETVRGQISL